MTAARIAILVAVLASAAGTLAGQGGRRGAAQAPGRCRLQLVNADRQGVRSEPTPGVVNYFLGGNVHARCEGQNVHIYSDSIASYGEAVHQFISQGNKVRYRDSTTELDTDFGQYFSDGERFEAQGNTIHRDLETGSTIVGQRIDYFRPVRGLRDELEVIAYNRPTVTYVVKDSAGTAQPPYVIIGNKVTMRGSTALYAGGAVTIDQQELKGSADSLWLDTGVKEGGQLLGGATLKGESGEGFTLTGRRIDIALSNRLLSGVTAHDSARLVATDVTLDGDSIGVALKARQVDQTRAWGTVVRPVAVSAEYKVEGDSLVIDTPGQRLSKVTAFGNGRASAVDDSAAASNRNWIAGQIVTVFFVDRESAGARKTTVTQLEARREARALYRLAPEPGQTLGSINYTRANRILVSMRLAGDSTTVDRVDADGAVDGIHLQPAIGGRRQDSTRVVVPVPLAVPGQPGRRPRDEPRRSHE